MDASSRKFLREHFATGGLQTFDTLDNLGIFFLGHPEGKERKRFRTHHFKSVNSICHPSPRSKTHLIFQMLGVQEGCQTFVRQFLQKNIEWKQRASCSIRDNFVFWGILYTDHDIVKPCFPEAASLNQVIGNREKATFQTVLNHVCPGQLS